MAPLEEDAFRASVKAYVEEHWRVPLPLER